MVLFLSPKIKLKKKGFSISQIPFFSSGPHIEVTDIGSQNKNFFLPWMDHCKNTFPFYSLDPFVLFVSSALHILRFFNFFFKILKNYCSKTWQYNSVSHILLPPSARHLHKCKFFLDWSHSVIIAKSQFDTLFPLMPASNILQMWNHLIIATTTSV